jgi:hypothetical protein
VPILIFEISGVPLDRREGLGETVMASGQHLHGIHEAWIVRSRARDRFCVRITGPDGFFRQGEFGYEQTDAEIGEHIRQALLAADVLPRPK